MRTSEKRIAQLAEKMKAEEQEKKSKRRNRKRRIWDRNSRKKERKAKRLARAQERAAEKQRRAAKHAEKIAAAEARKVHLQTTKLERKLSKRDLAYLQGYRDAMAVVAQSRVQSAVIARPTLNAHVEKN